MTSIHIGCSYTLFGEVNDDDDADEFYGPGDDVTYDSDDEMDSQRDPPEGWLNARQLVLPPHVVRLRVSERPITGLAHKLIMCGLGPLQYLDWTNSKKLSSSFGDDSVFC